MTELPTVDNLDNVMMVFSRLRVVNPCATVSELDMSTSPSVTLAICPNCFSFRNSITASSGESFNEGRTSVRPVVA